MLLCDNVVVLTVLHSLWYFVVIILLVACYQKHNVPGLEAIINPDHFALTHAQKKTI